MIDEKHNGMERERPLQSNTSELPATRAERNQRSRKRAAEQPVSRGKETREEAAPKRRFWVQVRLLPIWLRIILVVLLLTGAAVTGAMIGYGYIGDGQPADVLKKETWSHVFDIMNGIEK